MTPRHPVVLLAVGFLCAFAHTQVWRNSPDRPASYGLFPNATPQGGPLLLGFRVFLGWDGQVWQRVCDLPAGVAVVDAVCADRARGETIAVMRTGLDWSTSATYRLVGSSWQPAGGSTASEIQCMLFDPGSAALVAFTQNSAYSWNGSSWTVIAATGMPFVTTMIAADPARSCIVAVAPLRAATFAGQTFEWRASSWSQVLTPTSPPPRNDGLGENLLAYEPISGHMLLHGGFGSAGVLGDTWEYDGVTWVQRNPIHAPQSTSEHLTYDDSRGRLVLFLRQSPDPTSAWAWDGNDWQPVATATPTLPTGAYIQQFATDPVRQRLVCIGESAPSVGAPMFTWEWDGRAWSLANSSGPPTRATMMAYDIFTQRCLIFGGSRFVNAPPAVRFFYFGDTWTWDGSVWTQQAPVTSPTLRGAHALLASPLSLGVVLFGGADPAGAALGDTWLWSNGQWTDLTASLSVAPAPGACIGANGGPVDDPILVTGSSLWRWHGSWVLVDSNVPAMATNQRTLGLTASGNAIVVGLPSSSSFVETFEFINGAWARRGDGWYTGTIVRDPRRGSVLAFRSDGVAAYTDLPADEAEIGTGCGTPTPRLVGEGLPIIANPDYRLDAHVAAGAPVLFAMDFAGNAVALGGGCTQYLAAPTTVGFRLADARGFAALPVPVPANPALRGLQVLAQIAALQPGGPLFGIALSAGLSMSVGD
jgi:hypothetical protein